MTANIFEAGQNQKLYISDTREKSYNTYVLKVLWKNIENLGRDMADFDHFRIFLDIILIRLLADIGL